MRTNGVDTVGGGERERERANGIVTVGGWKMCGQLTCSCSLGLPVALPEGRGTKKLKEEEDGRKKLKPFLVILEILNWYIV